MQLPRAFARLTTTAVAAATGITLSAPTAGASDYCDDEDETFPTVSGYSPATVTVGLDPVLATFEV